MDVPRARGGLNHQPLTVRARYGDEGPVRCEILVRTLVVMAATLPARD